MKTEPTTSPSRNPGHACSDFTPQRRGCEDVPVPYWPVDEPIPYRLTETAPHYEDLDQRAREAGAVTRGRGKASGEVPGTVDTSITVEFASGRSLCLSLAEAYELTRILVARFQVERVYGTGGELIGHSMREVQP